MSKNGRIAVIAVIAVVAFGAAFLLTGGDDEATEDTDLAAGGSARSSTTVADEPADEPADEADDEATDPCLTTDVVPVEESPYQVTVAPEPDPPVPQGTVFEVVVQRDGAPVEEATVCLSADMSQMNHEGVNVEAEEVGEGRYELAVDFGMRGRWNGGVLVVEPGQTAASMPVSFNVQ